MHTVPTRAGGAVRHGGRDVGDHDVGRRLQCALHRRDDDAGRAQGSVVGLHILCRLGG